MATCCAYKDCFNRKLPFSKRIFFLLPQDMPRRRIWIENTGDPELLKIKNTSVRYICEDHFDPKYIRRQFSRTTLSRHAVPYKYEKVLNKSNKKDCDSYEIVSIDDEIYELSEVSERENVSKLKKRKLSKSPSSENDLEEIQLNNGHAKMINRNSNNTSKRNNQITLDEKEFEITLEEEINNEQEMEQTNKELNKRTMKAVEESYVNTELEESASEVQEIHIEKLFDNSNSSKNENYNSDFLNLVVLEDEKTEENIEKKSFQSLIKDTACSTSSENYSYDREEDKHFVLSLVGYFKRLPNQKKAIAKLKILQYLTELQLNESANL